MSTGHRIELAHVPGTRVRPSDFLGRADGCVQPLEANQIRVRTTMLGLNAGLKHRLGTGNSTAMGPAVNVGDCPQSDGIGIVVESRDMRIPVDTSVTGLLSWATTSVVDGSSMRTVDSRQDPLKLMTVLGHVGLTAYATLVEVCKLRAGETVWISAAAGGVGSCAVQIAQRLGANVIASAAGDQRRLFLNGLGLSRIVDRRADLESQLDALAPTGLDVYVDLVGGDHLRAALHRMRDCGRIALVGQVGATSSLPILESTSLLIRRRISLIGMTVSDHPTALAGLEALVLDTDRTDPLIPAATVTHGLTSLPEAFCSVLDGRFTGRGVVDVSQDSW